MLANLHTYGPGSDRPEFAADVGWGIGFKIEALMLRQPARQKNEDDALRLGRRCGAHASPHAIEVPDSQAEQSDSARLQGGPAGTGCMLPVLHGGSLGKSSR